MVLGGDVDFGSILGVEGNTAAITSADGFGSICFGGDNNIFLGEGGGGVEDNVNTLCCEGYLVAITAADGFVSICFGDDVNIFSDEGVGVEGGVDTFFGEGDVVGGTIENSL